MIEAFQLSQVPLLSAALITACLSKLGITMSPARTGHRGAVSRPPTVLSLHDSRPVTVGLALAEGALGVALLVTAHPSVRLMTITVFASATWVVGELRTRRPDGGCGCFGALSTTRVDIRSVVRAALFTAAAIVALSAPGTGLDGLREGMGLVGVILAVEITVFAALSPEIGVLITRLRSPLPCELRTGSLAETYDALHASDAWRHHKSILAGTGPTDVWRELCWRFLVYPGRVNGQDVDVVFAVSMREHHPVVRSAVIASADTGEYADRGTGHPTVVMR